MTPLVTILVAEDDEGDVFLLRRAFKEAEIANPLEIASDGLYAIEYLMRLQAKGDERLPGLVLLDLKMPRRDGLQVLQWIRAQPVIRNIPVIIFTSSANRHDIEHAYHGGANAFLIKPPSLAARAEQARFLKEWLQLVQAPLSAVEGYRSACAERVADT